MTDTKALPFVEIVAILNSGLFSDTILVSSCMSELKAHRYVLYCHSAYFRGAFKNGWKEAIEGRFYLQDDARTIRAMLRYMYTREYCDEPFYDEISLLYLDINLCIAADYYGVADLGESAESRFRGALQEWNGVREELTDVVRAVYAKNCKAVDVLKEGVVEAAAAHLPELESTDEFQQLCRELGPFTTDVLLLSSQWDVRHKKFLKTTCWSCSRHVEIKVASELSYECASCWERNDFGELLDRGSLSGTSDLI
ncbi:hypothetical protein B0J12DRAFT_742559 [Macrophomina phaseolina]|uniref:BTB domain-containing protein n=1 Tax=Macrophomina phaseolina TaxID=35725 RepID=A0ABQ8G4A1_9PEZI|nr:hypothetical protein B0J12DRAFT_742559 [Macrophomina phaseolina]